MKSQNWTANILKQLSRPTRLKGDTVSCPALTSLTAAIDVGHQIAQVCPIVQTGSTLCPDGAQGFFAGTAILTCGAHPNFYNQLYNSFSKEDRQGLWIATALRLGMTMVTAPASLTDVAKVAYYMTYGMQGATEGLKTGMMTLLVQNPEARNGAKIALAEISKARGYQSAFGIDLNPIDIVEGAYSDVSDFVSGIPGVGDALGFFGEQAKDFANTSLGQVALTAFATVTYSAMVPALGILGPQIASVAFAIPGLAKGDSFDQAWLDAFLSRLEKLIEYFGGKELGDIAGQFQPAVDKIVGQAGLADGLQKVGISPANLNQAANDLGVRTDIMQEALDYITKESSFAMDSTVTMLDGVIPQVIPATPGRTFDPKTGNNTGDTRAVIEIGITEKAPVVIARQTLVNLKTGNKINPAVATKQGKMALPMAMISVKANPPAPVTPLPAKKLHWWVRLARWIERKPTSTMGAETVMGFRQAGGAPIPIMIKKENTQHIALKAPPKPSTDTLAMHAPAGTFAPDPELEATITAPAAPMIVAPIIHKLHWWTRVANWLRRKPAVG